PNITGSGPNWLFDIDALTKSMNYKPVVLGNQSNGNADTKAYDDAGKARMETVPGKDYIMLPLWTVDPSFSQSSKSSCWELCFPDLGRKIYIELGSTSGIRACRETLNYHIWEVIQRGNGPVSVSTYTNGVIKVMPPKTAEEILARERERKARTTLLMALPEDHLAKFHKITYAKEMWEAIKSIFKGLHRGYDKFQSLPSQLEIHGAGVSTEDSNQKFLRSLPSAWSQVSLIMRTKPRVDSLNFDDLYNNLRVFESDVKGSTTSSSSTQNVAFVSENTSSTNEVSTAYGASGSSGHNPQREGSFSYTDELMYSFFANQSSGPQLDHEDLEQLDEFDLEEMDLKWQVAMISMRLKKFYKNTGRELSKGNQDSRRRDVGYTRYKAKDSKRRPGKQEEPKALAQTLSQMRARDKAGLGYGNQINKGVLSYENEAFESVFYSRSSDIEDSPVNDRYAEGMHAVPPPMTGIYIPYGPDVEINDKETLTSMPKPVVNEPKVVSQPKVWSDAPIIEEYESDSDDEHVSLPTKEQETPSFAFVNTLKNVHVPLDHFPINALISKVLSFMVKKGKNFSGNVTPLFDSMLVQPTKDEDQPESQPDLSPRPSASIPIPDSNPKGSGRNHGGQSSSDRSLSGNEDGLTLQSVYDLCVSLCKQVTIQAKQIQDLKAQIKKLKKKARPGRKTAKSKPTAHKDQAFDDLDNFDAIDYIETDDAHNEKGVSIEDQVSTVKPDKGTDKPKVSTDKIDEGIAELKNGNSDENATPTATLTVFGDDETIVEFLVSMSQNKAKQKGVEIKDVEDSDRPRPTSTTSVLTLKPLPKIDPKDKGKKVLEEEAESDAESEGVNEAERKFVQLANDEEIAKKVQEEWETEKEKKKLTEEEATKAALIRDYDDIQARIEANSILAARLQEEEREKFTIEERAKLLHDTIASQRRFLAQQRAAKIRILYEKVKRSEENFIAIGYAEDERQIKDVNKKATGIKKDDSIKEESKEEESTRKRKLGTRKKMKSRKRRFRQDTSQDDQTDSEKENDELRLCLTIATDDDKEVDYEILDKKGNGQRRYFSTLMRVLSIFDREDINAVYQLVMDRYQDEIPEGFDRVLWGDLMIMFNPSDEDEFWNSQQDWNVVSWKLHGSSGVHTLMTEAGLVIHMLVEKKYPLRKKVLLQMLELKLESEEDSTMALELIRFVKKLIAELEPEDSDGNEEDL
ncbi:hypothetical protein Tco_0698887, partial [Tanacetum coccineum]